MVQVLGIELVAKQHDTALGGGSQGVYGVHMGSLPPHARSYYDSIGDSVVWSVRYDLGMEGAAPEERAGGGRESGRS